ncbi:MAG: hypothetical protein HWE13_12915 [Gammaproteobacteria bacterium]|nr:hypothetical protein [Gammaproteobacteria bacterium]
MYSLLNLQTVSKALIGCLATLGALLVNAAEKTDANSVSIRFLETHQAAAPFVSYDLYGLDSRPNAQTLVTFDRSQARQWSIHWQPTLKPEDVKIRLTIKGYSLFESISGRQAYFSFERARIREIRKARVLFSVSTRF